MGDQQSNLGEVFVKNPGKDMGVPVETGIVTRCDIGLRLRSSSLSRFCC